MAWNSTTINTGKLLEKLFKSYSVSGETKSTLAEGRYAKFILEWKESYDKSRLGNAHTGIQALVEAERATKSARTAGRDDVREQTLENMGAVTTAKTAQVVVILHFLAAIFLCAESRSVVSITTIFASL